MAQQRRRYSYPIKMNCPRWAMRIDEAVSHMGGTSNLLDHLVNGDLSAVACPIHPEADGQMYEIPPQRWVSGEAEEWINEDRIYTRIGSQLCPSIILVRRPKNGIPSSSRKRGPRPVEQMRVAQEMRSRGGFSAFVDWTEDALSAEFGASRDTCRKARNILEAEYEKLRQIANIDK